MDPISIGLAFANTKGGASLLGGLGSSLGASAPAGPSNAQSGAYGSGLDGSGWSINFAGVQNAGSNQDKSGGVPGLGVSGIGGSLPWYVWAALAGAVVWRLKNSRC
jgi:hypothetical protein